MRGRDGGAGGGAPLAEGAIGVGAAGAGGQGAGGAGRQLARQLDGALTLALPAPVELGRGLHRHRPLVGRAGAGAARAGIDVRGAVVHRHAAAHQVRPPGPRRRLFPRPRFLAGGPLPRRATRGADLWHHPAATASARRAGDLAARRRPRRGARLPGSAVSQAGRPARAHGPLARPGRPRPGRDRPSLGVRPGQLAAVGRRPRPPGDPARRAAALPALRRAPRRRGRPAHRRLLRPLRLPGRDLQGARLRRPRADLAAAVLRGAAAVQCHLPVVGAGAGGDRQAGRRRGGPAPRRRRAHPPGHRPAAVGPGTAALPALGRPHAAPHPQGLGRRRHAAAGPGAAGANGHGDRGGAALAALRPAERHGALPDPQLRPARPRLRPAAVLARAGVDQHRLAGLARAAPARRDGAGRRGRGQHGRPGPLLRLPRVLRPLRRPGLRQRRLQLDRRAAAGRAGEPRGRAVVERVTIAFTPAFRGHPRVRPHGRHPGASRGRGCWSWPPAGPDGRPTCSCWRSATRRPWPASAAQPAARLSAGGLPVISDQEVVPEAGKAAEQAHGDASSGTCGALARPPRSRGSARTSPRLSSSHAASRPRMATVPPGQCRLWPPPRTMPSPSTDQKVPKLASIRPTPYFRVFSGTRASGRWAAAPRAITATPATAAPTAATGTLPAFSPKVITMKTTSTPSRNTPLNETTNENQSRPSRVPESAAAAAAVWEANAASSSWVASRPDERRIALRSHWRPNTSSRLPTTSCSSASGSQVVSAYPAARVKAASAATAAATPERAERQLRVAPIASTMVSASTNSTKDAVKVATSRPSVTPRSIRQAYRRRRPATRRWRPRPCRRS